MEKSVRAGNDRVLVRVQQTFEERFASGLWKDTTYDPQNHVKGWGEVVGLPGQKTNRRVLPLRRLDGSSHTCADITDELSAGDRVYFEYKTLFEAWNARHDLSTVRAEHLGPYYLQGEALYLVPWDEVLGVIREGVFVPIGGRVMLRRVAAPPSWSSALLHNPFAGQPAQGVGEVLAIGAPLTGGDNTFFLEVGDRVHFLEQYALDYEIEGERRLFCWSEDVLAVERAV